MAVKYRALVGIDYPGGRVEPGDETDALPAKAVKWLLDDGCIEKADSTSSGFPEPRFQIVSVVSSEAPERAAEPSIDEPSPEPAPAPEASPNADEGSPTPVEG